MSPGRRRRRVRYNRGGKAVHKTGGVAFGPLWIMDGGRDEPLEPLTTRGRVILGAFFTLLIVGAATVIALTR